MVQTDRSTGGTSDRLTIIRQVLAQALHLPDGGASLDVNTGLLGAMPEVDSMAVVSIITGLEQGFDFSINDDEIGAETLKNVGALLRFVEQKCGDAVTVKFNTKGQLQPEFIRLPSGRLFTLRHLPAIPRLDKVIVLCPPFAEELNKSRRQINLQAQKFCEAGFTVLIFDLYGTGDSDGAFSDASIEIWKKNYLDMLHWLSAQGYSSCILWAVRFGALFVEDMLASGILPVEQVLLWQPEFSGEQAIRQFLRLQAAANILSEKKGSSMAQLEAQLNHGNDVEVAGYGIPSVLYTQIKQLKLANMKVAQRCSLSIFYVISPPQTAAPERVNVLVAQWQADEHDVRLHTIEGSNFWSPADLVVVPELVELSVATVRRDANSTNGNPHDS